MVLVGGGGCVRWLRVKEQRRGERSREREDEDQGVALAWRENPRPCHREAGGGRGSAVRAPCTMPEGMGKTTREEVGWAGQPGRPGGLGGSQVSSR